MHRPIQKLIIRILAIIGISILSLLVLLYIFVQLPIGQLTIRDIIEDTLSKTLNYDVSIGEFRTNIFSRISLSHVSLNEPSTRSSNLFIKNAVIHYNIFALLSRTISISDVIIKELDITLIRDSNGEFILPIISQTTNSSKKPMRFILKKVQIENSSIMYDDLFIPLDTQVDGFVLDIQKDKKNPHYKFRTKFQSGSIVYDDNNYRIDDFLVNGSVAENILTISSISFSSMGLHCEGQGKTSIAQSDKTLQAHITLEGDPTEYVQLFAHVIPQKLHPGMDSVSIDIHVEGEQSRPRVTATLSIPHIISDSISFHNTVVTAEYRNDSLSISRAETEVMGGSITADGWINIDDSEQYKANVTVSDIDYSKLWRYLYEIESPYSGSISGNVDASGSVKSLLTSSLSGQIKLTSLSDSKSINPITGTFSYHRGDASIDVLQGSSSIKSEFVLRDSFINGYASVQIQDIEYLAGLANLHDLKGSVLAETTFDGRLDDPKVHADIQGSDLSYRDVIMDTLFADVQYEDKKFIIHKSSFKGFIESLSSLKNIFPETHLEGKVEYSGTLQGSIDDFAGTFDLQADSVVYESLSIPSLTVECHAENADLTIDHLKINVDAASCEGHGSVSVSEKNGNLSLDFYTQKKSHAGSLKSSVDFSDKLSFDAQLEKLSLELLGAVSDSLSGIQGEISGNVDFHWDVKNPNGSIEITVDNPTYRDLYFDKISFQGELHPDQFVLNKGLITLLKNDIRFRGKLDLDRTHGKVSINPTSRIQGEIALADIALQDFAREFLDAVKAKGVLTSTLHIDGSIGKPHLSGSLNINDGFLQLNSYKSPIEKLDAVVILSDSTLNINSCSGFYEGKSFNISGNAASKDYKSVLLDVELAINDKKALQVKGTYQPEDIGISVIADTFDVSFAEIIPVIMNAEGTLNASLDIKGPAKNPHITGWLKTSDLEILPKNLNTPFTKGALDIVASNERIDLKTCSCSFGDGSISSSGYVTYSNNTINDIALTLNVDNVTFEEKKKFTLNIKSCDLKYAQVNNGYVIDGTIVFGKTKYLEDVQISKLIDTIGKPKIFIKPSQIMMQTKLNIRITESKDLWIVNNLARIQAKADLNVIGTLAQPNLAGRIEITDGYIVYLDRKFDIIRGTMDFTDPNMINPIVDIQAETDIKNYVEPDADPYHITLSISGAVDKAIVSIQSNPALDEANILSLLTFGTTRDQIFTQDPDKYDTYLKDILLERAEQYSSQKIAGFVAGRMEQVFDLDDMSIKGNLFDFGESWGPQLVASKQLSKYMKVTYSTRVGYLNEQSIELDYELSDHLYLQGQADQDGNAGLDIIYRINFK